MLSTQMIFAGVDGSAEHRDTLEKQQRLGGQFVAHLLHMGAIIAAHADDLRGRDRREQLGGAEGHRLEVEAPRFERLGGCAAIFQSKSQVFFGSAGKIHNPRLAGAIFDSAVVGLILEAKAAVFHRQSSMRGHGRYGLGTVSTASAERALSCLPWSTALTA